MSPVSLFVVEIKEGHRAMNNSGLIEDYLIDRNEGMKNVITWFLNQVMQQEALNQIKARPYERNDQRRAQRNGIRKRSLKTIHGEVILDKPQFREVPFRTQVFDKYSRVEKSLRIAVAESYLQGVSTRKIQDVVSKFGLENISASEVSRIAKELDEKVKDFLQKPIEGEVDYLFLDASYFKVRSQGRYKTKALLIATGIHENGYREILGAKVADNEDEPVWENLFEELKGRGLKGVQLVISDGHKGIQKAVEKSFLGASWQMCNVHFMRAVLKNIPKKDKPEVAYELKEALVDESKMQELANKLNQKGYSKSAETIDRFRYDLWNYKAFPRPHWRRIRTTNGVERINKELKRRSRVAGAFSNDESLLRLAVCIMMDINEEWITGRRYLSVED
jgi:transposase-like protein